MNIGCLWLSGTGTLGSGCPALGPWVWPWLGLWLWLSGSGMYTLAPGVTSGKRAVGCLEPLVLLVSRLHHDMILNIYLASKGHRPDQVVFIRMRPCFSAQFRRGIIQPFSLHITLALFANWTQFVNTGK